MGRGDKRSRKGKIFAGSFGNKRKHHHKRAGKSAAQPASSPPPKDRPKP